MGIKLWRRGGEKNIQKRAARALNTGRERRRLPPDHALNSKRWDGTPAANCLAGRRILMVLIPAPLELTSLRGARACERDVASRNLGPCARTPTTLHPPSSKATPKAMRIRSLTLLQNLKTQKCAVDKCRQCCCIPTRLAYSFNTRFLHSRVGGDNSNHHVYAEIHRM
jgi:hypothetical protein